MPPWVGGTENLGKDGLEKAFEKESADSSEVGWVGGWEPSENGFLWEHPPPREPPCTTQDKWEQLWGLGANKKSLRNKCKLTTKMVKLTHTTIDPNSNNCNGSDG